MHRSKSGPERVRIEASPRNGETKRPARNPQRKANTVGLVVEVKRPGTRDAVYWYCDNCGNELYSTTYQFDQIGTELSPVLEKVHASDELRTCEDCGTVLVI